MYIRMQIRMFLDVISDMHLVWFQPSICWVVPGSHRSQWQLGKYRGMGCCGGEVEGRLKMWKKTVEWVGKRNQRCSFFESNKVVWHAVYGYWILHLTVTSGLRYVVIGLSLLQNLLWCSNVLAVYGVCTSDGGFGPWQIAVILFPNFPSHSCFWFPFLFAPLDATKLQRWPWMMVVARCCGAVIWR